MVMLQSEAVIAKLLQVDRGLAGEFENAVKDAAYEWPPETPIEVGPTKRSARPRSRHPADTILGIEERLKDVEWWTRGAKAALALLHERARDERAHQKQGASSLGPYRSLEARLFGDPVRLMRNHKQHGLGLGASLIDGPETDLVSIAGLELNDEAHDRLWGQCNWQSVLNECNAAECIEVGEQDGPGVSDVFYWISVDDPEELARQIREVIIRHV